MRVLFNHHLSSLADTIGLMRDSQRVSRIALSHARDDTPLKHLADDWLPELAAEPDGGMPARYPKWLLGQARDHGADMVVPYRHRIDLADHAASFARAGKRLLVAADRETMETIEDKPRFLRHVNTRMEIPVTAFRTFSCLDTFDRATQAVPPHVTLCVKPARGIYGTGFRRLLRDTGPGLLEALTGEDPHVVPMEAYRAALRTAGTVPETMVMPFVAGPERSVDFACLDGRFLGAVTRLKTRTHQLVGPDPVGEEIARRLVEEFGLSGVLNLQTLEDAGGEQRLLELNTRTSGGIGMTALAGVNLPGCLLSALAGDMPETPARARETVRVARRETYLQV